MKLPKNLKDFKAYFSDKKNRHFFHTNGSSDWDFINYYNQTYEDFSNKIKKINTIANDYKNDLNWVISSKAPREVVQYAYYLKRKKIVRV